MRLLYVAIDQSVPGTLGGSVHVQAVAEGLAALGHSVHVATQPGELWPVGPVHWYPLAPPLGWPMLRWTRAAAVAALARRVRADVIMERYYNFGGEGIMAATRLRLPSVLEVNAPVIDHPGSTKALVDRALIVRPMQRWRDRLCRAASLIVTTTADILPAWIDRSKVAEGEWGADVHRFHPGASGPVPFARPPDRLLCVFAGAFREWHGAVHLATALAELHKSGDRRFGGVFIGDGPERAAAERAAAGVPGVIFTGALPHATLPAALAACDVGVAPFDATRHPPLRLTFYWSPLKIFEYMAAGLPVVAPALPRLQRLVSQEEEGLLYDPDDPRALSLTLPRLADRTTRERLGRAARARAVREFSWEAHCALLDARLRRLFVS